MRRRLLASVTASISICFVASCAPGTLSLSAGGERDETRRLFEARRALARGDHAAAREQLADRDNDALLGSLDRGLVSYYAGDYQAAAASFDRAYWLDEARATRSLSNGAAALLTNDRALPYRPGNTERAMLHYYAAMSWLGLDRPDEAAVEARRLSALLARLEDEEDALPSDVATALREVAVAVFEAAGSVDEADVERRRLQRGEVDFDTLPAPDPGFGVLVLAVERGFAPWRAQSTLGVAIAGEDIIAIGNTRDDEERVMIAARAFGDRVMSRPCGWSRRRAVCGWDRRARDGGEFNFVYVAWPELRAPRRADDTLELAVGDYTLAVDPGAELSEAIADDFGRGAGARAARALARVALRQGIKEAGDAAMARSKQSKKQSDEWKVAGMAAYVVAGLSTLSERADTRSWALLPDELSVVRMELPPGEYVVRRGSPDGPALQRVHVRSGRTTVAAIRDWGR